MPILLLLLAMQLAPAPTSRADEPIVAIITIGPGDMVHEKFGHNMLWIHEPARQIDVAYNWGLFSFGNGFAGQLRFVGNFIQGRLWYWMDGLDPGSEVEFYKEHDRTIWVQELNLSPEQKQKLLDFCRWNQQPANRTYLYDYFRDNCSTRTRDALDTALDGQIKRQATTMPSDRTLRSETDRLMAEEPVFYIGLDFLLGHPTDRKLSAWQEMFVPMRCRERLNEIMITDASGRQVPLVKREVVLHTSQHIHSLASAPNPVGWFLLVGAMLGGAMAWLGDRAQKARRPARWGFGILTVLWSLLSALAGLLLLYLWLLTDHAAARPNENILQFSPLLLPMVVLVPHALRHGRAVGKIAVWLAAIALAGSFLGLLLKPFPFMYQVNGNMIALALPANMGLTWGIWKRSRNEASL